jgi:hypothetical protein
MLDAWDFAIGDVRIDRDLRWRRSDSRIGSARNSSHVGQRGYFRNVYVVGNIGDLRNAGNVGIVGNVWLRLDQHRFLVDGDVADNSGRQRSNGNSAGIHRDRKSWGQFRNSSTDDQCIAPFVRGGSGTSDPHHDFSVEHYQRHRNANSSGRLTNHYTREGEQP